MGASLLYWIAFELHYINRRQSSLQSPLQGPIGGKQ